MEEDQDSDDKAERRERSISADSFGTDHSFQDKDETRDVTGDGPSMLDKSHNLLEQAQ